MASRVGTQIAVVTHDKDPVFRDHDFELDLRRLDLYAVGVGVEVAPLVKGIAIDGDPALAVATNNLVSWQPNNPLDQVAGCALRRQPDEFQHFVPRRRISNWFLVQPAAWVGEDDNIATLKVGDLLYHHTITNQERALHRLRRDDEHLPDERAKQGRHHHCANHHDKQFPNECPSTLTERPGRQGMVMAGFVKRLAGRRRRSLMSGQQLASGPAVIFVMSGAGWMPGGTVSKVSGLGKRCRRSNGQTTTIARPTTKSWDTNAF